MAEGEGLGPNLLYDCVKFGDDLKSRLPPKAPPSEPRSEIRKRAGIKDVRIHDLRQTFASVAVANGQGLSMIGKLLGHSQVQTTARYAHLAADPVRVAANHDSSEIADMLGGREA